MQHPEVEISTNRFVFFWTPPTVFGQWTRSLFTADRIEYTCTEQFMMAEKARLFGDTEICQRIPDTDSPRSHKALGRTVRGFSEKVWNQNREDIVYRGNIAKFSQNPDMLTQLLSTGDRVLV